MYQNHNYVKISEFGLEEAPGPYSTNEWEEFSVEIDFDNITASAAHDKYWKSISAEHLSKVWRINMELSQKKLNVTDQRGVRTDNTKITKHFVTCDRMLIYNCIRNVLFTGTFFAMNKYGNHCKVTHADIYLLPVRV